MKGCVLVVDDSEALRSALKTRLRDEGYEVVTAADGARGLALLSFIKRPAVAVVDYAMPAIDGAEFVARAARDPSLRDVPIILLSGDPMAASNVRDVFAFLKKPCVGADLIRAVGSAFESLVHEADG